MMMMAKMKEKKLRRQTSYSQIHVCSLRRRRKLSSIKTILCMLVLLRRRPCLSFFYGKSIVEVEVVVVRL